MVRQPGQVFKFYDATGGWLMGIGASGFAIVWSTNLVQPMPHVSYPLSTLALSVFFAGLVFKVACGVGEWVVAELRGGGGARGGLPKATTGDLRRAMAALTDRPRPGQRRNEGLMLRRLDTIYAKMNDWVAGAEHRDATVAEAIGELNERYRDIEADLASFRLRQTLPEQTPNGNGRVLRALPPLPE